MADQDRPTPGDPEQPEEPFDPKPTPPFPPGLPPLGGPSGADEPAASSTPPPPPGQGPPPEPGPEQPPPGHLPPPGPPGQPEWSAPAPPPPPAWSGGGSGALPWEQPTPYGAPVAPQLADWGQRAGAFLLDMLIFSAIGIAISIVVAIVGQVLGAVADILWGVTLFAGGVVWLAFIVMVILMEAGPYGQTPGKQILSIRVIKADGRMLSKAEAVGRYFAKILSQLPCYLGYLWPLWDDQKRTFHDMILDSRVVTTSDRPAMSDIFKAPFGKSG